MTGRRSFTVHGELDGYLADLRDPTLIPLLGQAGNHQAAPAAPAAPAELAELAELAGSWPGSAQRFLPGSVLVIVPPGSAAAPVAAALAARTGGKSVECASRDLPAGTTGVQHVVMAGLARELTMEMVLEALDATAQLRRAGAGEAALGVVLGRSLDELSWLIAKGLSTRSRIPPEHAQLCVAPWGEQGGQDAGSGTRWLAGADTRAGVLMPLLTQRRHGLVSFAAAGREHAMILADTVVCGAGPDLNLRVVAAGAPTCAFSGQCFRAGVEAAAVIRATDIRADVVYANSCMSWRPGHGLVAADYQLTNAFQHGIVAAFIGAVHQMVPDIRLNRLAHRAAAAGASAGQIGIMLNERAAGREPPHYVVLGLPWVVPLPQAGPVSLGHLATLLAETSAPDDGAIRACLLQAGRAIQGLRELPLAGFLPAGDLAALDEQVSAMVAGLKGDPSVVRAASDPRSSERLLNLLADADLEAAFDLHDFWQASESALGEIWGDFLETTARPGTGRCPYCAGPTATVTGRHPAYPALVREVRVCHACGPLIDLPGNASIEAIKIDCPSVWPRPGSVDVEVTITPGPALPGGTTAATTIQVAKAAVRGLRVPEPRQVRLTPGEPVRLRAGIEVEAQAFAHHEHFVRVAVVAGGQVHGASRLVAVRPASSR